MAEDNSRYNYVRGKGYIIPDEVKKAREEHEREVVSRLTDAINARQDIEPVHDHNGNPQEPSLPEGITERDGKLYNADGEEVVKSTAGTYIPLAEIERNVQARAEEAVRDVENSEPAGEPVEEQPEEDAYDRYRRANLREPDEEEKKHLSKVKKFAIGAVVLALTGLVAKGVITLTQDQSKMLNQATIELTNQAPETPSPTVGTIQVNDVGDEAIIISSDGLTPEQAQEGLNQANIIIEGGQATETPSVEPTQEGVEGANQVEQTPPPAVQPAADLTVQPTAEITVQPTQAVVTTEQPAQTVEGSTQVQETAPVGTQQPTATPAPAQQVVDGVEGATFVSEPAPKVNDDGEER